MGRIMIMVILALLAGLGGIMPEGLAVDKVRYGVAVRVAQYIVPLIAAEEQGFWKQNGLEVKWWPFRGASDLNRAIVADSIDMGSSSLPDAIQATTRGIPIVALAQLNRLDYHIWVRVDSPIKGPEDLKGAKLAIRRMGGMTHAYARFIARKLDLKEIKIIDAGGPEAATAAMIAGRIDGRVGALASADMLALVLERKLRSAVSISEHFPKEWAENAMTAPKWLIDKNPELVRRTVRAALQGVDFMLKNKAWSIERMKKELGFKPEVASAMFDNLGFGPDARISRKAVENVRDFLIEYEIIPREKVPPVDEVFTNRFVE